MVQYYNIAGLTVQMDTFGRTLAQAEPYRCDTAQPQIVMSDEWRTFKAEHPHLSIEDCEYMATGRKFYGMLLRFGGCMLHSSAVVVDGRAYLFSAASGTGKSTHTQLWLDSFGDRAYMLNDDKPAIRLIDGKWYAYGTPWSGKYDKSRNARVPLAGICFLNRGDVNEIHPFVGKDAVIAFMEQTLRLTDIVSRMKLMDLVSQIVKDVPFWQLECNMDKEAAMVSYRAMSGCDS